MNQKESLSRLKNFFRMDKNASGKLDMCIIVAFVVVQTKCHCTKRCDKVHFGEFVALKMFSCFVDVLLGGSREKSDADLLRELELLLQPQVATTQRCKTLKELSESDKITRLADVSAFAFGSCLVHAILTEIVYFTGDHFESVRTHQGFDYADQTDRASSHYVSILSEIDSVPI